MYQQDSLSALDAITEAQRIAFAPMLFQTALCLRNAGVLTYLDKQGKCGASWQISLKIVKSMNMPPAFC